MPTQAAFPKAARLLKADVFSSALRLRPWHRSIHFVLHAQPYCKEARLGLVVGKKYAPRAATRNMVRRMAREAFRLRRAEFNGWDILLRLHARLANSTLQSATSAPLKALCRAEINALLSQASQEIARRAARANIQAAPQQKPCH